MRNALRNFAVLLFGFVAAIFGVLVEALTSEAGQEEDDDRQVWDADVIGEYNFRTNRLDAGTDPNGWYEEDM